MLSSWDDYPVHQVAETIRHVGTSDRNFYDRYYFNLHGSSDELFMIMGLGQYPNLAVSDSFALVRRGTEHRVVRASKELVDRMETSVGPLRVEVLDPLHEVRVVLEPNEWGLSFDLRWKGAIPAFEEPRHYIRKHGRVLFDTMRFAQTGYWTGEIHLDDDVVRVTPDRWKGTRDRSWGVRPVGEAEPPGVHAEDPSVSGMWNYAPMQFDDYSIIYIVQEPDGVDGQPGPRVMEEAVKVWNDPDRPPVWLGHPEHDHTFVTGTRRIASSVLRFPEAPGGPLEVRVSPLVDSHIGIGTGYGLDADWRHGAWQGPLVVQGLSLDTEADKERFFGIVDAVARFETSDGDVGYGLHEYMFLGPYARYGFTSFMDVP